MPRIFGRHHVRANFYHFVSFLFLLTMILWGVGIIPDNVSTIIGMVLFITDYIAEMYDPHPDTPGPWFKSHFHRLVDGREDECVKLGHCEYERIYDDIHNNPEINALFENIKHK